MVTRAVVKIGSSSVRLACGTKFNVRARSLWAMAKREGRAVAAVVAAAAAPRSKVRRFMTACDSPRRYYFLLLGSSHDVAHMVRGHDGSARGSDRHPGWPDPSVRIRSVAPLLGCRRAWSPRRTSGPRGTGFP